MIPSTDRAAIVAILVKWTRAWQAHAHHQEQANSHQILAQREMEVLSRCSAALALFGYDTNNPDHWKAINSEFASEWRTALDQPNLGGITGEPSIQAKTAPAESVEQVASAPPMPRIKDIVLQQVEMAGDQGARATDIRQFIEKTYLTRIHEKTVGMTLFRLSKQGLVTRDGRTWFAAKSVETKNPAGATAGPTS
jgi:hypothetical protein